MENLPIEIEEIIYEYKYQLEHTDKLSKSLDIIKSMKYEIYENEFGYNESNNGKNVYVIIETSRGENPKRIIYYTLFSNLGNIDIRY